MKGKGRGGEAEAGRLWCGGFVLFLKQGSSGLLGFVFWWGPLRVAGILTGGFLVLID